MAGVKLLRENHRKYRLPRQKSNTIHGLGVDFSISGESITLQRRPSRMRSQSCVLNCPVYSYVDEESPRRSAKTPVTLKTFSSHTLNRSVEFNTRGNSQAVRTKPDSRTASASVPDLVETSPIEEHLVNHVSQPSSSLTELQRQQLRMEECKQLMRKCEEELELSPVPREKWYEMKSPEFHLEAHRHSILVQRATKWQKMLRSSHDLLQHLEIR